ncbi:MAG: GDSL-type esterase/lipase family protein [Candidatus Saccharimonadales bacterium]
MRSILVDGSSTAYGMHGGADGGWAVRLHRETGFYNEHNVANPICVYNNAIPGITLPVVNRKSYATAVLHAPSVDNQIVRILSVGINEAKILPGRERPIVSLGHFASELEIYSSKSLLQRAETIYVGPQPVDESKTMPIESSGSIIEDDYVNEYAELMRQQANWDLVPYIDVRAMFAQYDMSEVLHEDGRHPNAFGHQLIYQAVRRELVELNIF